MENEPTSNKPMINRVLLETSKWKHCVSCESGIGCRAYKHVMFDCIPMNAETIDILFVGEGPGAAENVIGRPFIGPAGRLLRSIIANASNGRNPQINVGFTNLLVCRPVDEFDENRPPSRSEIMQCAERLKTTINSCQPLIVACLGRIPSDYVPNIIQSREWGGVIRHYKHPSFILRNGGMNAPGYTDYNNDFLNLFSEAEELKSSAHFSGRVGHQR